MVWPGHAFEVALAAACCHVQTSTQLVAITLKLEACSITTLPSYAVHTVLPGSTVSPTPKQPQHAPPSLHIKQPQLSPTIFAAPPKPSPPRKPHPPTATLTHHHTKQAHPFTPPPSPPCRLGLGLHSQLLDSCNALCYPTKPAGLHPERPPPSLPTLLSPA